MMKSNIFNKLGFCEKKLKKIVKIMFPWKKKKKEKQSGN